jgi:HEAT repeat protein
MLDQLRHIAGATAPGRRLAASIGLACAAAFVYLASGPMHLATAQVPDPLSDITLTEEPALFAENVPAMPPFNPVNRPDVLDLEPAVAQAELILAVRLVDMTETKIVHGGRSVEITQQYRFEPVRVLKGIYARDELLMTGQDLGIYRFAEGADRLARGQLMLVLLGRQGANFFNCNCNGVATLGQSIPRLDAKDDPLLAAVGTLIGMTRVRDRAERVASLREALNRAKGRDVSPLLLALRRRALLAAQDPRVADAVLPHLNSGSASIREVAARTLAALLESMPEPRGRGGRHADQPNPERWPAKAVDALVAALSHTGPDLAARVAMIDALGSAGGPALAASPKALDWLNAEPPATTFTEASARLRVLGKAPALSKKAEVIRSYESLLLDAPADVQAIAGRTLGRVDAGKASELILARLVRKHEAGLDVALEIRSLGELPREIAPLPLLNAWKLPLDVSERLAFAAACAKVFDARLVPAVSTLLDPRQPQIRLYAVEALRRIDTDEAASALWPHLDEETDLARKLRLIAFLGRHGFRDGYAQALEHLSQAALREEATAAIAAIGEPKVIPELQRIWQTSNDPAWNAAAIRTLARLGQQEIAPKLLEIARTPADPLAPSALIGLGDLGSAAALPIVRDALRSRRDELVIAAARAAAKLLAGPELKDDTIRERLAALLADADASHAVRHAALSALTVLNDFRLGPTLALVVREASLEGTPFVNEVESALKKRATAPH